MFHAGAGVPENIEHCEEKKLFEEIYYLGLYCNDDILEKRLLARPEWQDKNAAEGFVKAMKGFNAKYRFYGKDGLQIEKLDTTNITLEESSQKVRSWISAHLPENN